MHQSIIETILTLDFVILVIIIAGLITSKLRNHTLKESIFGTFHESMFPGISQAQETVIPSINKPALRLWDIASSEAVPLLLGLGLILMPFYHNLPLYPISYSLVILATLIGIYRGDISLGPIWVWVPLAIITISALIFSTPPTGLLMVFLFCIYTVSKKLGYSITTFFGLAVVVYCLGVIVYSVTHGFVRTSGLIAPRNVNIANAAILATFLLWDSKYKWLLSGLVIVGLFFTGSDEAFAAVLMLGAVILIRRDWSKKLLLPIGALILTLIVCTPLGVTSKIWGHIGPRLDAAGLSVISPTGSELNTALDNRWPAYVHAFDNLQIVGHGYQPFDDDYTVIHDVPLRAGYELGILSGIAWLIAFFYALIKSKAKYALVAIGVLCLFDHMFWTQIPAFYWVALALALSASKPDLIFRDVKISPVLQM